MSLTLPRARVYGTPLGSSLPNVGGPRPVYDVHRADFLTMVLDDGEAELQDFVSYTKRSPEHRARIRVAHVAAGMTRYAENTCQDALDWFENPAGLVPYLKELHADGLGPILLVGLEDAPRMQAKYKDLGKLTAAIQAAFQFWAPLTTEVWLGVEVNEYWTEGEVREVARAVRDVFAGPIAVHYGSGQLGGDWGAKKAAGVTHFAYQSPHPAVEDAGQGFLADPEKIKADLERVLAHVKGQVKVIASEYAFFGRNPSKSVIQTIAKRGAILGKKALEVDGIAGISNGGPGYWPPEAFVPLAAGVAVDEVDLSTVRFYSTHPRKDITKTIATWPIESILKARISGDSIYVDHTASLTWPRKDDISGTCWVGFLRGGVWNLYTWDYLRPGNPKKEWGTDILAEPRGVGWKPSHGETVIIMASTLDPRFDNYPTFGRWRTQIVKVVVP